MEMPRAIESLKAAELCLDESLANSAASRAYYVRRAAQFVNAAEEVIDREKGRRS